MAIWIFKLRYEHEVQEILYFANICVIRSINDPCAINRFSIFKVQIIDPIVQNDFHMKI
jgi:hypothetical protein